jgi:hypothetical protein
MNMEMIPVRVGKEDFYIKDGAKIYFGSYKFHFLNGDLLIEEVEVYAGLVLKKFPIWILIKALENPDVSWMIEYPTTEKE